MKAIMVMFDSLNRHMLPPYGGDWVHAPNFTRLAERAVTFDNCYSASMPCMPARRELHTGRTNFLHRSWGPLEPFDESMPELLKNSGVYTHLASDHQHYWEDGGATYHNRYNSWEFSRGQEGDAWKGHVADPETPPDLKQMRMGLYRQDWINRSYMPTEAQHPQTLTFNNGLHFIDTNHDQDNWFLQIETFDPHEPFFSHQKYKDLYPHDYDGPHFDWPDYARVGQTRDQVEHVRNEYAALVSMCDAHLGKVMDAMDEYGLWEDTLLIVCTDHGFLLGEKEWWGKNIQPWYNEIVHTPLFICDPRHEHGATRRESLVQMIDFAPTLLDFFGVEIPKTMIGQSLSETVAQDRPIRAAGLFGSFGGHVNITDGRYIYMRSPKDAKNAPLTEYTLMPTHMNARFSVGELQHMTLAEPFSFTQNVQTLKIPTRAMMSSYPFGTMLFDLESDPEQEQSIVDEAVERRMIGLLVGLMQENDAPPEQYERLGLPCDGVVTDAHLLLAAHADMVERAKQPAAQSLKDLPSGDGEFNLDTPIQTILNDDHAARTLLTYLPMVAASPMAKMMGGLSLKQVAGFANGLISAEILTIIANELAHQEISHLNGKEKTA